MKKYIIILFTGFLLVFAIVGCKEEVSRVEPIRPIKAIQMGTVEEFIGRSFPGKARAFKEVNLGFEVAGTLAERPVKKGDQVQKGQLLARLDPRDFQNALNAVLAELERAQAHRDRIAQAATTGAVAKQELTNADARLKVARAEVEIRKKGLEDASITAPFDGVISTTYAENFQRVQAKETVLRLLDETRLKFDVNIPENLISKVTRVRTVFIRFDAFPEVEIQAEIGEVGTEASETTRTYPVTLYLDPPEGININSGMAGKVYGKSRREEAGISGSFEVPVTSIFEQHGKSFVWVVDEKSTTVHLTEVETLELTNLGVRVKGDLKSGDWVATAGVHSLEEGQKVRLLKEGNSGGTGKEVSL